MSILQRYVLKETLKAFLPAFVVLAFIMALGFCVQLVNEGLDVVRLQGLPRFVLSLAVPVVLPSALLTAVIMAFGRLSADVEITAMRGGGVHLLHVIWPVCLLAFLLSLLVGYFQFQVVPGAWLNISLLKNEAVRQILMDKVALSAQRRLAFPPWYLQYEDFRDGNMQDILIINVQDGLPNTVITARSGRIEPDPVRTEYVRARLQDCTIVQPSGDAAAGRDPVEGASLELDAQVGQAQSRLRKRERHLSARALLRRLRRLQKSVSRHPTRLENPSQQEKLASNNAKRVQIQCVPPRRAIQDGADKLADMEEGDKRDRSVVTIKMDEIKAITENLGLGQQELIGIQKAIRELQPGGGETGESYDEVVKLQKKRDEMHSKIKAFSDARTAAGVEIDHARARLASRVAKRENLREEEQELRARLKDLEEELSRFEAEADRAKAQDDLRSTCLRIHKRAAQALAALTFVMVGIPLGIMTRRRSIMLAFVISFGVVLGVFYPFLIFGQVAAEGGLLPIGPAMWSGNVVTSAIGLVLMAKVLSR